MVYSFNILPSFYIAIVIAFLLGPMLFYILSRRHKSKYPHRYEWLGVVIFPIIAGIAAQRGIFSDTSPQRLLIAFTLAYVTVRIYTIYVRDFAKDDGWLREKRHRMSLAGWYYSFYLFMMAFFAYWIIASML